MFIKIALHYMIIPGSFRSISDDDLGETLQMFYSSFLVFMARDSKAVNIVSGFSVSSSLALAQKKGGM